jgi:hypothetical protein
MVSRDQLRAAAAGLCLTGAVNSCKFLQIHTFLNVKMRLQPFTVCKDAIAVLDPAD